MTISFDLTLLGHLIGTLGIRIELDQTPAALAIKAAPPKMMDVVSDYFADRWFRRHS